MLKTVVRHYLNEGFTSGGSILDGLSKRKGDVEIESITVNGADDQTVWLDRSASPLEVVVRGRLARATYMDLEIRFDDNNGKLFAMFSPGHCAGTSPLWPAGAFELRRNIRLPGGMNRSELNASLALAHHNVEVLAIASALH